MKAQNCEQDEKNNLKLWHFFFIFNNEKISIKNLSV